MKKGIYIILAFALCIPAFAGIGDKYPVKWGKVSVSEFRVKPAGADSMAPAVVLCDFGNMEISNRTFYDRHTRIKILSQEGMQYASVEIPFQTKDRHDEISELKAQTLVLENGRIVRYPVPANRIETIKISNQVSIKKFTFEHVKPGAIVEYKYTIASLDFENLHTWFFQREIPVLWSELRFQVPLPFTYLVTFQNNRPLSVNEQQDYGKRLQWLFETKTMERRKELSGSDQVLYATPENRFKVWAMNDRKRKIIMRNLPGLSSSQNPFIVDSYPRVRFDLFESSGNLPRAFLPLLLTVQEDYDERGEWSMMHDPAAYPGYVHYRLKTWSEFNDQLLASKKFGMFIVADPKSKSVVDSVEGLTRYPEQRIDAIFTYVITHFRWNGEFTMYATQPANEFIRSRTGSSADINLLLITLLQKAGIRVDPLLVRTSNLGSPEMMYPVKNEFNHVIAVAEINGTQILLDATSGTNDLRKLNKMDIGTRGWIVRDSKPGWIEIFTPPNAPQNDKDYFNL